jgi:transposase
MPKARISMSKIRDIIRLNEDAGLSIRQISGALSVSRPVVTEYLKQAKNAELKWADVQTISDDELLDRLRDSETRRHDPKYETLMNRMPGMITELGRQRGRMGVVTRQILWEEYIGEHADGYQYSQFCHYMNVYTEDSEISMHLHHEPGEKMFLDYAGKPPFIVDVKTGIQMPVELYVAVFPSGSLIYTEATLSQDTEHTIRATMHAMEYAGGAPKILVPDNLKAAVDTPSRYEPGINFSFDVFSQYYGCAVIPARVRKPKDKALVEAAVQLVYTRVLAPLRNHTFTTVDELNTAIWEKLDLLNSRAMQKIKISRTERFNAIEKDRLRPLPGEPYEIRLYTKPITVQKNYHVFFPEDKHYYSVPADYRGLKVRISYTHREIEIYHKNVRIAFHRRETGKHQYTTNRDHMTPEHRFHDELGPEKLISWAGDIGPETKRCIEAVIHAREVPQQAFRSCLGILNLPKKYSRARLEAACRRANEIGVPTYGNLKRILERRLDISATESDETTRSIPSHGNIRGRGSYQGQGART